MLKLGRDRNKTDIIVRSSRKWGPPTSRADSHSDRAENPWMEEL
jgi:hypothetical protein